MPDCPVFEVEKPNALLRKGFVSDQTAFMVAKDFITTFKIYRLKALRRMALSRLPPLLDNKTRKTVH